MANTMRWRYGETNPVMVPNHPSSEIEIGDLVYLANGTAWPAGQQSDEGTELANQFLFRSRFLGVAMQPSGLGETEPTRVATTGVFEFDCDSGIYGVGDYFGAGEGAGGAGLDSQRVATTPSAESAIGRSVAQVNPAADRLLVDLVSSVMRGGVRAAV